MLLVIPPARDGEADPTDIENSNLRVAIGFDVFDLVNVTADYENFSSETDADVLSDSGAVFYGTLINSRSALDTRKRTKSALRLSLNDKLWIFDSAEFTAYTQDGTNEQLTSESRTSFMGPQNRTRYSEYDHNAVGYTGLATTRAQLGASDHVITVGVDYSEDTYETMRTGATFSAAGISLPEYSAFPTRDFPTTDITETGVFLQDEIALLDGRLRVTPAIHTMSATLRWRQMWSGWPAIEMKLCQRNFLTATPRQALAPYIKSQTRFESTLDMAKVLGRRRPMP